MRSAVSTAVRSVTETNSAGIADGVTVGGGETGAVVVGVTTVGVGVAGWLVEKAVWVGAD